MARPIVRLVVNNAAPRGRRWVHMARADVAFLAKFEKLPPRVKGRLRALINFLHAANSREDVSR